MVLAAQGDKSLDVLEVVVTLGQSKLLEVLGVIRVCWTFLTYQTSPPSSSTTSVAK